MKTSRKKSALVHVFSGRRRRRKEFLRTLRNGKTFALYRAACDLLASSDFEGVSVARLAKEAGCSVGAFYGRFSDKNAFLRFLIAERFRQATDIAAREFSDGGLSGLAFSQTVRRIVEHVSRSLSEEQTAGIVRAAVKLGFADSNARKPFDDYRNAIADRALELLAPHIQRGGEKTVREAMRIVFASLTDAILTPSDLFKAVTFPADKALCRAIIAIAGGGLKPASPSVKTKPKVTPKPQSPGQRKVIAI